jgi:Leucine-rich repeat (LRR) protein
LLPNPQNNAICTLKGSLMQLKFLTDLDLSHNQLRDLRKLLQGLARLRFLQQLNLQVWRGSSSNVMSSSGTELCPILCAARGQQLRCIAIAQCKLNSFARQTQAPSSCSSLTQAEMPPAAGLAQCGCCVLVCLQGNPCCEEPGYRLLLIYAMPSLQVLDHHQVRLMIPIHIKAQCGPCTV